MSELAEKVKMSIERLKAFEPKNGEGYYLAFSGGKDSVVIKALADMAGVKYDSHYRVTSVDPPELVQFIKEKYPDVARDIPRYADGKPITMWNLIPKKLMPPTQIARYCCEKLKETGGDGRATVTGVRWAESVNRKKNQGIVTVPSRRKSFIKEMGDNENFKISRQGGIVLTNDNEDSRRTLERCIKRSKILVNPIIDWTNSEVWEFIRANNVPYCGLYDCGLHRLGCIGCPMSGRKGMLRDFARWPKYKQMYLLAFGKMLDRRKQIGKPFVAAGKPMTDANAIDVFNWWIRSDVLPGQMDLFDGLEVSDNG